jgi:hypothetical protein
VQKSEQGFFVIMPGVILMAEVEIISQPLHIILLFPCLDTVTGNKIDIVVKLKFPEN